MNIGRRACLMHSLNDWSRSMLACAVALSFALAPACSSRVPIGHGQLASGGTAENVPTDNGGEQGGSGGQVTGEGGRAPAVGSAGRDAVGTGGDQAGAGGDQAGASGASCTGTLEAVNQAVGTACPTSLCEATAQAKVSCSLSPGVLAATEQRCLGQQQKLIALSFDIADGVRKTCVYAWTTQLNPSGVLTPGAAAEGPLVGASVTDVSQRFCDDTSTTISAGPSLPGDCASPRSLCNGGAISGDAGAPNGDTPELPVQVCLNHLSSSCEPCCPATPPDCSDKPDGYPGYSCTPAPATPTSASYCSCACNHGAWACPC
jgi:hypothetical protein